MGQEPIRIAVVVGNPKRQSRTLGVAVEVASAVSRGISAPTQQVVVDLAEEASHLFDEQSDRLADLGTEVAQSHVVVVASPTFKATYTGILKAFFDRYGYRPLEGSVGVPVMTGAANIHALAVEVHLRPLLVELGATVPAAGLFVTEAELPDLEAVVGKWASSGVPLIRRSLDLP
jgi:FMN reductase